MGKQIRNDEKTSFQSWYENYVLKNELLEKNNTEDYKKGSQSSWKKIHEIAIGVPPEILQEKFETIFKTIDSLILRIDNDSNYTHEEKGILLEGLVLSMLHNHEFANQIIIHQRTQIGIDRKNAQKKNSLYSLYKKVDK